jgi:uncharacterized membrane protein (UPF0127 family)
VNVVIYFPSGARVLAELVTTRPDIERGLMHRRSVPEGAGMLFDMGRVTLHRFWMKDTLVPLDMLFIRPGGMIVGIVENTVPHDPTLRGVDVPSRYVLEVPGGWCTRHGVAAWQRVEVVRPPG